MSKNTVDHIEIWPDDPEGYIRHACETWGLPPPVEYKPVHLDGNLVLDATLEDGRVYRLIHAPISEQAGPIVGRQRTEAELKYISRMRAAAGRAGAASRWGDGPRATACVRLYPRDAAELRRLADAEGRMPADIVARLLEGRQS